MRKIFLLIVPIFFSSIIFGCKGETDSSIESVVDSFATHFLAWHYQDCMNYVTDDSRKQITLLASNISQEDIDVFNKTRNDVSYEVKEIKQVSDTTAIATIEVKNAVFPTSIDAAPEVKKETKLQIQLKREKGNWRVVFSNDML